MSVDEQINRLSNHLTRQSLGPIDPIFNATLARLSSAAASFVAALRQAANDRPLVTLLLSYQVGYLVARLGRRHARG